MWTDFAGLSIHARNFHSQVNQLKSPPQQGSSFRTAGLIGMLLAVTAVWGWTFLIVKDAVASYSVLSFLALRFLLATLVLAPLVRQWSWKTLRVGLLVGAVMAAGYLFQTFGLQGTSAADAGLLTGLFVVFTPLFDWMFYRNRMAAITLAAVVTGLLGTGLLTLTGSHGSLWSDLLEVLTALAFAIQLVWLGHYTQGHSSMQLAFGQMVTPAILFLLAAEIGGHGDIGWPTAQGWFAIVLTGVVASALAFWVQTYVQQSVSASRTALILLSEPAFAALFAIWLGGERLSPLQWTGAVVILATLMAHEAGLALRPPVAALERPASGQA